ncbi:DUF3305 domain-containing protein [Variovorax sp. PCZ-1]|uniref:DUF3305 domain-containing protein n=1 Tax=Variovorax sp. PCZ-1 TaxID=2835533 RepID=UPI001BCAC9EF|nr:DUF3305 domain-containing protein [Variovorax sp. PCZ-1]MBS7807591.1 DUF3305 domain-containing protein [Variovorax sp. PCZ-1]
MSENQRPDIQVAVTMRKERVTGAAARWVDWRWKLHDVALHSEAFGHAPRCLHSGEEGAHWLFPAMTVQLYRDDAEGYYLNATTEQPCWFVMWRMEEELGFSDELIAVPQVVSLSYNDAGRWLDSQETVEQVPCPIDVAQWIAQFAEDHFVAEPKKRKRPESFKRLEDRFGNPVSISAGPKFGAGDGSR